MTFSSYNSAAKAANTSGVSLNLSGNFFIVDETVLDIFTMGKIDDVKENTTFETRHVTIAHFYANSLSSRYMYLRRKRVALKLREKRYKDFHRMSKSLK